MDDITVALYVAIPLVPQKQVSQTYYKGDTCYLPCPLSPIITTHNSQIGMPFIHQEPDWAMLPNGSCGPSELYSSSQFSISFLTSSSAVVIDISSKPSAKQVWADYLENLLESPRDTARTALGTLLPCPYNGTYITHF